MTVAGVYVPPDWSLDMFKNMLLDLDRSLAEFPVKEIFFAEDFNAKSELWSAKNDARGRSLVEWAASLDFYLLNSGSTATCSRWQSEFVVDFTWASS